MDTQDTIDHLITEARNYVVANPGPLADAVTGGMDEEDLDVAFDRAMIDRLFEQSDEATKLIILSFVTLARAVRLGANTALDTLTPEQRQRHEVVLSSNEACYVTVRATLETRKALLTPLEQQIVERLVEVKFNR